MTLIFDLEGQEGCKFAANILYTGISTVKKNYFCSFLLTQLFSSTGNGYIPISALKEILRELDSKLTDDELDGIIDEIDEDGSGTVDFDGKK